MSVRTVAVAGSCMTRDPFNQRFNPRWRDHFDVVLASNQSSLVAMMSPPIEEEWSPALKPLNDYNAWNVASDLTRELVRELPRVRPDVLVVDFFADVWFGVAELPDGRFLTDNRWKTHFTDLYQDHLTRGELRIHRHQDDPEGFFALWAASLERFAAHVAAELPETRVVLHRGWVTSQVVVPGRPRPQSIHKHSSAGVDTAAMQSFWDRLDDHAEATTGWDVLDLRDLRSPTHVDHAWGPMPVHYVDEYHHRFLADLLLLLERDAASPRLRAAVDLLTSAVQEPWARRLAAEEAVVARQRDRLQRVRARLERSEAEVERLRAELEAAQRPAVRRWAGTAKRRLGGD